MNKFLYISLILLQMLTISQTELIIENNQLTIISKDQIEGFLFYDDTMLKEVKKDDYVDNKIVITDIQPGIYTLYDLKGKQIIQKIVYDDKTHIAFDEMVRSKNDNHYLFQTKPKMTIVSSMKEENYIYKEENGNYIYEFEEEKIEFFDQVYYIYVDESVPNVEMDEMLELEPQVFITNQEKLYIKYMDTYPEMFKYLEGEELEIQLHDGINDLSCFFMDYAQNKMFEKVWVIRDLQAPIINENNELLINHSKKIVIEEVYLDLKNSYVIRNDNEKMMLESNEFIIEKSGQYRFYLVDFAGNKSIYEIDVNIDMTIPTLWTELNQNNLMLHFSEPLSNCNLELMIDNESIKITNQEVVLEKEGDYSLCGSLVDLSGNINVVNEQIHVDFQKPTILLNLDKDVYLEYPKINCSIGDFFEVNWVIELSQSNEILKKIAGKNNLSITDLFSELGFTDLNGEYTLKIYANDGTYENELITKFIIDVCCEPIELKINGYKANQVNEVLINNDVSIEAICSEGDIYYKLYKNDTLIMEEKMNPLIIRNQDKYSKLELFVSDPYGHTNTKTIHFKYPYMDEMLSFNVFEKTPEVEVKEEVPEITTNQLSEEMTKTEEIINEKNDSFQIFIGGVVGVFIIIRIFLYAKNRYRKNKNHLLREETVLLEDSESTRCLHNYTNQ